MLAEETRAALVRALQAEYGWTSQFALEGIQECQHFFHVKARVNDWDGAKLSPSFMIDQVWHVWILHTKLYMEYCDATFGHIMHHDASKAFCTTDAKAARYAETRRQYAVFLHSEPKGPYWPEAYEQEAPMHETSVNTAIILYFKDLTGDVNAVAALPDDPLSDAVVKACGSSDWRIIFAGKQLNIEQTPSELGLRTESTLHIVMRLNGC